MISDEQIGRNLAAVRGEMSQSDLAKRMRDRGFKWSQATVWSVEKGERPLRLSESEAVAELLGVGRHVFTARDGEERVYAAARVVRDHYEAMRAAMAAYDTARGALAFALDELDDGPMSTQLMAAAELVTETIDSVVEDYRDFERREFAATLAREGVTAEEWFPAEGQGRKWLDAYNDAQARFSFNEESDDGEHKTTP
ncbi:helix-turn-helix transcriptional regulator [Microbacterium sp. NPDC089190]|uniref:helix-turn-helix domain-containing protein n=1 Tax=Microbacterium sp. NPDC089190 TaxID=3155063 RepID=UPI00344C1740